MTGAVGAGYDGMGYVQTCCGMGAIDSRLRGNDVGGGELMIDD